MLLQSRAPMPIPVVKPMAGDSHRSPCRWSPLSEAPSTLPSHPSQQLWSQPVECPICPAVDSSWVELCIETSQQRPFPGPQAALCGHCAGAMPAPGVFLGHSTGLHGCASWGKRTAHCRAINPGWESKIWPLPACQGLLHGSKWRP